MHFFYPYTLPKKMAWKAPGGEKFEVSLNNIISSDNRKMFPAGD